jgi:hypothetical protein
MRTFYDLEKMSESGQKHVKGRAGAIEELGPVTWNALRSALPRSSSDVEQHARATRAWAAFRKTLGGTSKAGRLKNIFFDYFQNPASRKPREVAIDMLLEVLPKGTVGGGVGRQFYPGAESHQPNRSDLQPAMLEFRETPPFRSHLSSLGALMIVDLLRYIDDSVRRGTPEPLRNL